MTISFSCKPFIKSLGFFFTDGGLTFTRYNMASVYGAVGSTVTFNWTFSGGLYRANWGIRNYGAVGTKLVVLNNNGQMMPVNPPVPSEYSRRVSGKLNGYSSSGQVIFTLQNITKSDGKIYGCEMYPSDFSGSVTDFVELVVQGGFLLQMEHNIT